MGSFLARLPWRFIVSNIVQGALWAVGGVLVDLVVSAHKKGFTIVLKRINLLFHPSATRVAVFCSALFNLSGLFAALGAAGAAWKGVLGDHGTQVAAGCILAGIFCAQIAGWGRSTITEVDMNITPDQQKGSTSK